MTLVLCLHLRGDVEKYRKIIHELFEETKYRKKNNITHNRIKFHHDDDANDAVVVVLVVFELL